MSESRLITGSDVHALLTEEECMRAVEQAFKLYAEGLAQPPGVLGIHATDGSFHIKAGMLDLDASYFVCKVNANFTGNPKKHGLPTIQGIIVVCDAHNGKLLALMDSIEITILRTGAATVVAAKYLSRANSKTIMLFGCGNQGRVTLRMLTKVRALSKVYVYDTDPTIAQKFANDLSAELKLDISAVNDWKENIRACDIVITCTPSRQAFLGPEHIAPGTFIGAVGADSEGKQELDPRLLANNKVVADLVVQCARIGELQHAIGQGLMRSDQVHAELGEVIAGKKSARERDDEIIIFDSTGTALQDVAAAAVVFERSMKTGRGEKFTFHQG